MGLTDQRRYLSRFSGGGGGSRQTDFDDPRDSVHYPTRPVDKDKAEAELTINIQKATSPEETAPKQRHVRKSIVYTWDYRSSLSIWTSLRVQPILADEVQTFKALIVVHKVLQEGHPITIKEGQGQTSWLETCARTVSSDGQKGYGALIRAYVSFILSKLRFHRSHPEFNGLFEYEEYVSLKGIDDPNQGYGTITDLMDLQDQIESFQKLIFAHFRPSANNECRISALVPLIKESWGIYRFITSMLRAMYRRTDDRDALEAPRQRYNSQHYSLRKFYYECIGLKYLTGLINVPKLGQGPPDLLDSGGAVPDLPNRPTATQPPATPDPVENADSAMVAKQARMLKEYEDKQAALQAARLAEEQKARGTETARQRDFEELQRQQAERERLAQEELLRQQQMQAQMQQMHMNDYSTQRMQEIEREMLAMRGQWERDQMMLEQYDQRVKGLESELATMTTNAGSQLLSKDELIKQLTDQVNHWRGKYEALAKLYSEIRSEHLDMFGKLKQYQLKTDSAQEAIGKMGRDMEAKNLELTDMIRERDRARFDVDQLKGHQKAEVERLRRDLCFANERLEDATRNKSHEATSMLSKYNRQLNELEESLQSKQIQIEDLLRQVDEKSHEIERIKKDSGDGADGLLVLAGPTNGSLDAPG
ncbi:sla2 Src-like adaptor 2 [Tulasnella sp. 424]|nr:sla2 Src-like adaptor 2 [Tulasnella sp. 424]KAG8978622.1 sla2 Src-like adaptor 2 [Tulasnella sp. 425]